MSYYRNILQGQFQLGDIVFGRGTNIQVEDFEVAPADQNVQDYQRVRSDEINFGQDFNKPTTMSFNMNVMYNHMLPEFASLKPNFWHSMPGVPDLAREWGFDEGRKIWNQMKPMYVCGRSGIPKIVFGRPGQFGAKDPTWRGEFVPVVADFRRADTYGYGIVEHGLALAPGHLSDTIHGTGGDVPSWIRILVHGPLTTLTVTFSNLYGTPEPFVYHLNKAVGPTEVVEVSSYPWERRVVSSTGENLSSYSDGPSPYLDRLRIPHNQDCTITVATPGSSGATQAVVLYRDVYRTLE